MCSFRRHLITFWSNDQDLVLYMANKMLKLVISLVLLLLGLHVKCVWKTEKNGNDVKCWLSHQ